MSIKEHIKENFKLIFSIILLLVLFFLINLSFNLPNGNLKIAFLDIGQGDAIFIQSPDGNQIIFDGGVGDNISSVLPKQMSFFDRSLDMLVVTNPDKDHFEGFIKLLGDYTVPLIILPPVIADNNPVFVELLKKAENKGLQKIIAIKGQRIDIGGGAYIDILFPDRDLKYVSENEGSIIAKLVYKNTSVLLTGDTTSNIEKYLLNYGFDVDADILKVAHHGSKTSSAEEFIKAVSPDVAVISAGQNNSYGHPHKEVLDIFEKSKVPVLGTYNEGSIMFESDGESFWRID
jgi:competence protein ComEC